MEELNNIYKYLSYIFTFKKRAIYIGCLGHHNLGDDAVYTGIKKMVNKKIALYDINYSKISSGNYLRKIYFPEPNYIILGGGTIIRKGKNESYLRLLNQFSKKYSKAKLFCLGTGVANPEFAKKIGFPTDIDSWKEFLDKCFFVSVRGPLSKNILNNDWAITPKVEILYDPALYFKQSFNVKKKSKTIGVNFCDIAGRIYGNNQEEVSLFAKSIVNKLVAEGWNIILYPTTSKDISYMKKALGNELVKKVNVYNNYTDLEKSLDFFKNIDLFFGMRLHAVVFSCLTSTPFYAVEYEQKTSDFLKSIDFERFIIRTDKLNTDEVIDQINLVYKDLDEIQKQIYDKVKYAKINQVNIVQKLLKEI